MKLDKEFIEQVTCDNYKWIFINLLNAKTDAYTNEIKLPMGVDGLKFDNIKRNIDLISKSFCKRAKEGRYVFSPFREIQIPKAPYTMFEFKQAQKEGKLRTLAISTINDTIFQSMIYSVVYGYIERKFYKTIDDNIFGYRKEKSVYSAIEKIKKYIDEGYVYGLDGDIEKYFDNIDHQRLYNKIQRMFGKNTLITKYLKRFIKVKRVSVENRKKVTDYLYKKPITTPRNIGIPQGGVLSGMLANLYLHNFDLYIVNNLSSKYDIQYIRYADDFIILCKDPNIIIELYKKIKSYMKREKLNLHNIDLSAIDGSVPNENKTKAINLQQSHYVEFLGFRISPKYIGVKKDNIIKFKKNIKHIIQNSLKEKVEFKVIISRINAKIYGNASYANGLFSGCKVCNLPQKPQSWISFFIGITDMRIFKNLDIWIRKQLFICYRNMNNGKRLNKKYFRYGHYISTPYAFYHYNLQSLFETAIFIKNWYKKYPKAEFCECKKFVPDFGGWIS